MRIRCRGNHSNNHITTGHSIVSRAIRPIKWIFPSMKRSNTSAQYEANKYIFLSHTLEKNNFINDATSTAP